MSKIEFESYKLENGLTVILHQNKQTPLAVVNVLYKVGSRNEDPEKTGLAHLFEHLMFSGSAHANNYDEIVEKAGGENNAFTNTDITNYYIVLPSNNIEVALWLESDRMFLLNLNKKSLDVQRKVVIEEFKQRYLNKPYGDVPLLIRPLLYKKHPYQWPTIGKKIEHIEQITLDDVTSFYRTWYSPNNAILVVGGNFDTDTLKSQIEKWFGDISNQNKINQTLISEPEKNERTFFQVERDVPSSALYIVFLMPDRLHPYYYAYDMISDILGNGKSSRLYNALVQEKKIFQDISCYISGSVDKGFLMIEGKVHDAFNLKQAEKAVWDVIYETSVNLTNYELQKVKNKYETIYYSSLVNLLSRVESLAFYESLGDANLINNEIEKYSTIELETIKQIFKQELITNKSSVLYYQKRKK